MTKDEKIKTKVMWDFLHFLNSQTNKFILKGGTSLSFFYDLNRFSEDLDFDGVNSRVKIGKTVKAFSKKHNFKVREIKKTNYGEKYMINYKAGFQLKIETSTRLKSVNPSLYTKKDKVLVYNLEHIANLKLHALQERDKIRDIHDVIFLVNNKWSLLTDSTQTKISNYLQQQGYNKFIHITKNQDAKDILIDVEKLTTDLLKAFEKLKIKI